MRSSNQLLEIAKSNLRNCHVPCHFLKSSTTRHELKVGYHTESMCQYQPASFSSAFKLSGTACLMVVGVGGWGFPPQIWDM